MLFRCVVHPKGLSPLLAAKAWHLRICDGLTWEQARAEVRTTNGEHPGQDAVKDAVSRGASHDSAFGSGFSQLHDRPRRIPRFPVVCPLLHEKPRIIPRLPPDVLHLPLVCPRPGILNLAKP